MPPQPQPVVPLVPRSVVKVYETPQFERDAKSLLPLELRGLHLILADNPLAGEPVVRYPGLFDFKYAGGIVVYAAATDFLSIYLLQYIKHGDPPIGDKEDEDKVKELLKPLAGGTIFVIGKKLAEWAWEIFHKS